MSAFRPTDSSAVNFNRHNGVGLIEVLIALFILAFGSLAISNMHTDSLVGLKVSSNHFKVNSISNEIAEFLKAASDEANTGAYNTQFEELTAQSGVPLHAGIRVSSWKELTSHSLPSGQLEIACAASMCSVSIQWRESLSDGVNTQTYNVRVPL